VLPKLARRATPHRLTRKSFMGYQIAADLIVLVHFAFILFVIGGGFIVLKWRWFIWLHLPAAAWGTLAITFRWICPLTPLENSLRRASGNSSYSGGFIRHYLEPIIYPTGFDPSVYMLMGIAVILINLAIYSIVFFSAGKDRSEKK